MGRRRVVHDDFVTFLTEYGGESERALVVLAGSYLEGVLERTLRTWLADDLPKTFRGLDSAQAMYELAGALGVIPNVLRADLEKLFAVRHHFAHKVVGLSLADPALKNCWELWVLKKGEFRTLTLKEKYLWAVAIVCQLLTDAEWGDRDGRGVASAVMTRGGRKLDSLAVAAVLRAWRRASQSDEDTRAAAAALRAWRRLRESDAGKTRRP